MLPEWAWERWQWRGTPHSPKLQRYWSLTIRLFSVISRTLVEKVLSLSRDAVSVFCSQDNWANVINAGNLFQSDTYLQKKKKKNTCTSCFFDFFLFLFLISSFFSLFFSLFFFQFHLQNEFRWYDIAYLLFWWCFQVKPEFLMLANNSTMNKIILWIPCLYIYIYICIYIYIYIYIYMHNR